MTTVDAEHLLAKYATTKQLLDDLLQEKEALKQSIIPKEVSDQLIAVDVEFQPRTDLLKEELEKLAELLKHKIIELGQTVKGSGYTAVFTPGRVSWDDRALAGYAASHPEIKQFRKEGGPSVTLRGPKNG